MPPGEAKNFAAVVPVIRISANTRNGRSDYLSKLPIYTAYRNSAIPGSLYTCQKGEQAIQLSRTERAQHH